MRIGRTIPFLGSIGQIFADQVGVAANPGTVGEYQATSVAVGSAVTMTTAVSINLAVTTSLGDGDWDLTAYFHFIPAATTSVTKLIGSISPTTGTLDMTGNRFVQWEPAAATTLGALSNPFTLVVPRTRFLLTSPQSVFAVAQATFTVAGMTVWGHISARRAR